ncbi:MAG TPA: SpoIIE family protein phosphatase [Clostridia bacterium]|nr:SpoIIE family protein phosphatase [Clostridia bacterium]
MQTAEAISVKPVLSASALRAAPMKAMRVGAGFICGAAGMFGFSPLALPAVAAAWLCLDDACFVLVGALLGTLVSKSYASFSACALFGGAELLLSLFRAPKGRNAALLRALLIMALAQAALLPFIYPAWGNEFFVGAGCLIISPAIAALIARGVRALAGYLNAKRLSRMDAATLAILLALLAGALMLSPPAATAAGLVAMLLSAVAVCRERACAAGALRKTRRDLIDAAGVAKGIAQYIGGSVGGDTLARSQLAGMGGVMEKLAAGSEALMRCRIRLVTGTAGVPMKGSALTGDALAVRRAGDTAIFILSDGMGTGEAAHRESSTAAALLADMLCVGYGEEAAQSGVNDLMLLSGEETYATLDAALVDLMTGELRMLKFGAPPSYILRDGRVRLIEGPAPPAGILPEARAGACRAQLKRNDAFIMMTDGLMEALGMELVAAIVERVGGANTVQDAADALVAAALERGYADDMSAFVARVEGEPLEAHRLRCDAATEESA